MKKAYLSHSYTNISFHKCKFCDKNVYSSKSEAEKVKKIREEEEWGIRLKIYKCPHNNGFHLTSIN